MSTPADLTTAAIRAERRDPSTPLRYQRPELPGIEEIARYYQLAEDARFYSNGGPCHRLLERRLSDYLGGGVHFVPVANCTLGLMAAIAEMLGTPEGERRLVAVPAFTFTASACAIRWAGFEPLFVDIDPVAWQMDPAALAVALERDHGRIAGVLGCSTFGTPAPDDVRAGWRALCSVYGIPLLIDSAAGFGAIDENGRLLGTQDDVEVFSFHATKPFAIGEGGAIVTPDAAQAERLASLINFGVDHDRRVSVTTGINAKMSEIAAATALAMLDRFDDVLASRRSSALILQERLSCYPISFQQGSVGSTWQVFQVLMDDAPARERAVRAALMAKVEARTSFDPPLHRHPAFAEAPIAGALPVTEQIAARSLSLPMNNSLTDAEIEQLVDVVERATQAGTC